MSEKDDYLNRMNSQLDAWNKQVQEWQAKVKEVQAGQRAEYERQLEMFRQRRDEAIEQLRKVNSATGDAWMQLAKNADQAWDSMRDAYDKASAQFFK